RLVNPAFFAQITNQRMRTNVPAIYYFTNLLPSQVEYAHSGLTTISRQFPDYQNRRYEMGELIIDDSNVLYRSFEADNTGVMLNDGNTWEVENNSAPLPNNDFINRYEANDNDRLLLPAMFSYTFTPREGVTLNNATIELRSLTGAILQTDVFSIESGQTKVPLDYSDRATGWYQLAVSGTGTGTYLTEQYIYLNDALYDQSLWAVINIGHDEALSASSSNRRLLEADGSLRHTASDPETPIFNIRIPNSYTYWRYKPHPAQFPLNPTLAAEVENDTDDLLVSKNHLPNTQFGVQLEYINSGDNAIAMLPSPVLNICTPNSDGRNYSDVHLGLLPLQN
ncbi:MAG: hypothetical protein AAGJ93_08085, partial [Bacteroidota bacterium]